MKFLNNLLNRNTAQAAEIIEEVQEVQAPTTSVTPGEWFTSKEHYLEFRAAFKAYANDDNTKYCLSPCHFALYAILRNRDWKKGWTLPTKPGKQVEHKYKLSNVFNMIKSPYNEEHLLKPFDGTITTEMLIALRENLDDYRK